MPRRGGAATALAGDPALLAMLAGLLGEAPVITAGLLLDKGPGAANWEIGWHQDTSSYCEAIPPGQVGEIRGGLATFRPRDDTMGRLVTARVAVDDDTTEAGGLFVQPGSHRLGNLWPGGGERFTGNPGVAVPQPPGGVLFFRPLLFHRAGPNRSGNRRRVLHLTYRRASERLTAGGRWLRWPDPTTARA